SVAIATPGDQDPKLRGWGSEVAVSWVWVGAGGGGVPKHWFSLVDLARNACLTSGGPTVPGPPQLKEQGDGGYLTAPRVYCRRGGHVTGRGDSRRRRGEPARTGRRGGALPGSLVARRLAGRRSARA